tara:strand:+ start:121 stop:348 length:228 start_codon:yes stop_codon:yes gene_type:complete
MLTRLAEKSIGAFLEQALESSVQIQKYPKTTIDVFVLVIQDDGGRTCLDASLSFFHTHPSISLRFLLPHKLPLFH